MSTHLRSFTQRLKRLEALPRLATKGIGWSVEEQVCACRSLLAACCRGDVERTPEGYVAITDCDHWQQPFEIEPGRWEKRCKIIPEQIAHNQAAAKFLTALFQETGKYFPVRKEIGNQTGAELLAEVYRHYGRRVFA